MSSNYVAAVARIKQLLTARVPARVVTRTYQELGLRDAADLEKGIYTILCRGIEGYHYEVSDHWDDSTPQTELGDFVFTIVGQMKLDEDAEGEDVDAAEFAMLAELESFADSGIADETLKDLLLRRAVMSQQQERPYAWVFTEWRLRLFD